MYRTVDTRQYNTRKKVIRRLFWSNKLNSKWYYLFLDQSCRSYISIISSTFVIGFLFNLLIDCDCPDSEILRLIFFVDFSLTKWWWLPFLLNKVSLSVYLLVSIVLLALFDYGFIYFLILPDGLLYAILTFFIDLLCTLFLLLALFKELCLFSTGFESELPIN